MAKDNIIGLAMELDVTDLKSGISEVNKIIKNSRNEFNSATAGLDKWSKSSEGLTAKLNQLDKQLSAQQKAVSGYKAEIERVSKLEGDHSVQLDKLKEKLQKAEIEVKKTESAISKYSKSLDDVTKENKQAESAFFKLNQKIKEQKEEVDDLANEYKSAVLEYGKNSKEAKTLKKELDALTKELKQNESQVKKAEDAYDELDNSMSSIADLGATVKTGLIGIGGAVAGLATAFFASAESTREFRTNMGKLETAFETAGLSAKDAEQTYSDLYSVVADEGKATEASAHIAKLSQNQEDLANWTKICTGVYATFGDSLPIENLAEASNETAKTGQLTGGLADALNWAGVSEDAFQESLDACTNEQERQALITETLNGLYDDASEKYQQTNKDIIESNKAQAELNETMARLGEMAEPIITEFKKMGASILENLLPLVEDLIPFIKNNAPIIISLIGGIASAFVAWKIVGIITSVVNAMKAFTATTTGATVAMKLLNLVMAMNPIGIIITAITALIATFILLWNNCEGFRDFWIKLWETLKSSAKKAWDFIKNLFSSAWEAIKSVWNGAGDFFSSIWEGIKSVFSGVISFYTTIFTNAWNAIKNIWSAVVSFFSSIWEGIKNIFSAVVNFFKNIFTNAWNGVKKIWNGATSFFSKIWNGIKKIFETVVNFYKNIFSNAWNNVKKVWNGAVSFFSSIWNGIKKIFGTVVNFYKNIFTNAWNAIKKAWSNPTQFFKDIVTKIINVFKQLPSQMGSIGKNIAESLWNGIKNMRQWLVDKVKGFGKSIVQGIKDVLKIKSPSKVMSEVGKNIAEGVGEGIEKESGNVVKTAEDLGEEVKDSLSDLTTDPIDTSNTFSNFVSDFEDALGMSESKLEKWRKGVGGALEKVADYGAYIGESVSNLANGIMDIIDNQLEAQLQAIDEEKEATIAQKDEEIAKETQKINAEMALAQQKHNQGLLNEEEFTAKQEELEQRLANFTEQKEQEKALAEKEALKKKNEIEKKRFNAEKANNIAQALIQGAVAILTGFAQLGPIGGAINAGVQAVLTGVQVGAIASEKYVPLMAKGGIVDNPTLAVIGEAGKEAVMPLENNTGWISDLAHKISAVMQKDYLGTFQGYQMVPAMAGDTVVTNNYTQVINSPKIPSRKELYRDTKNLLALKGV